MTLPFRDDLLGSPSGSLQGHATLPFQPALFWLLLLLLAQRCAVLTWRLFRTGPARSPDPWQPSVTSVREWRRSPRSGNLSRLSLFGKALQPQADKAAETVAADAPKTQLNAQLNGVLASSDPAKSIAIIALATGHRTLTASGTTSTAPRPGYARCLPIGSSSPGTAVTRP